MEMYYANGPQLVQNLKAAGHQIFLDLKLHDIPNTVYRSLYALTLLGVDMLNVHAMGGLEMMRRAKDAIEAAQPDPSRRPLLIAVTQLTSTNESQIQDEQLTQATLNESVLHYAQLAQAAGLDGVVCSPLESQLIKDQLGPDFITVTPGIRPQHYQTPQDDQVRITTPAQAEDALVAYEQVLTDWQAE